MWLHALKLFKNSIDTQGKLRLNLHSLSVSELWEYGRNACWLYSKSSLTLKEWRFNRSFPWVSVLFFNSWAVSSHMVRYSTTLTIQLFKNSIDTHAREAQIEPPLFECECFKNTGVSQRWWMTYTVVNCWVNPFTRSNLSPLQFRARVKRPSHVKKTKLNEIHNRIGLGVGLGYSI
jgi:hypothetical protein